MFEQHKLVLDHFYTSSCVVRQFWGLWRVWYQVWHESHDSKKFYETAVL